MKTDKKKKAEIFDVKVTGKLIGSTTIRFYENQFNIEHDGEVDTLRLLGTLEVVKNNELARITKLKKTYSQI
jgi:hypothetical protein